MHVVTFLKCWKREEHLDYVKLQKKKQEIRGANLLICTVKYSE